LCHSNPPTVHCQHGNEPGTAEGERRSSGGQLFLFPLTPPISSGGYMLPWLPSTPHCIFLQFTGFEVRLKVDVHHFVSISYYVHILLGVLAVIGEPAPEAAHPAQQPTRSRFVQVASRRSGHAQTGENVQNSVPETRSGLMQQLSCTMAGLGVKSTPLRRYCIVRRAETFSGFPDGRCETGPPSKWPCNSSVIDCTLYRP